MYRTGTVFVCYYQQVHEHVHVFKETALMYQFKYMYNLLMIKLHVLTRNMYIHMYTSLYVQVHVSMLEQTIVGNRKCLYNRSTYMYMYMHVCVYTCWRLYMYTSSNVLILTLTFKQNVRKVLSNICNVHQGYST